VFKEGIAKFLKLDNLMENLTGYVETRIEILKYDLKEDLASVLSKASVLIAMVLMGLFCLLFISIALAMVISRQLGYFAGFGLVSLFYLIVVFVLLANRDSLGKSIEVKIKEVIKQKKK
jgi:hypothetical protein